nr:hypothetical protein BaRGS_021176 [Batillaria attramentaria]
MAREKFDWGGPTLKGPFTVCGEGQCKCSTTYADCSGHDGNLTYIPKLPASIKFLNFSHNKLHSIEDPDFFANVTGKISGLSLSDNELSYICEGAAQGMANLTELYLDFNHVSYNTLVPILVGSRSTLERLDIRGGNLGPLPKDAFFHVPLPRLRAISLYGNQLLSLNLTAFKPLTNLQYLDVELNRISEFVPDFMPSLRVLNLRRNRLVGNFLQTCSKGKSLFPSLERLDLSRNHITTPPNGTCLPNLATLNLSGTLISGIPADTFNQTHFPNLTELVLDDLVLLAEKEIEENAFRNPKLRFLSMQAVLMSFGDQGLSPGLFAGLPNLTSLLLGLNDFASVSEAKFKQFFGNLTSLQTLSLRLVSLPHINANMLGGLKQLRQLDLSYNYLNDSTPSGTFDNLTHLQDLNLASNYISMVTKSTFGSATRQGLRHLDLSGNPFNCSADLVWFCQWMKGSPAVFNQSANEYACANKPDTGVLSLCSSTPEAGSDAVGWKSIFGDKDFRLRAYRIH